MNRKFSFNSPPPCGPPVRSRSLGSTARAGPRSLAPEGFNLHTRLRVGLGPPRLAGPRPAAQPPGLGPPAAARAPSLPSLPAGGALRRPSALRRSAHPLPAERCSLGPQSVTCSARRARAGADRQTDRHSSFAGGRRPWPAGEEPRARVGGLRGWGPWRGRGWVRVRRVGDCVAPRNPLGLTPYQLRLGRLWGSAGGARGLERDLPHRGHPHNQGPVPA